MITLGLRFVIDTHLIDDDSAAMAGLWKLHGDNMIQLLRTDVVDTELSQISDPEKRARLMALSAAIPEQLGVMVVDHSRLDHAVFGSEDDQATFDKVWAVLSPGRERSSSDRRHVRDAMNVWTAIRYGADAFVTLDGSGRDTGMLDRARAVREAFNDFPLMTPVDALAFADRMLATFHARHERDRP